MCKTSTKVFILEVMGRHAGWIAASAELANSSEDTLVHKILLPEVQLDKDAFLDGIQNDVKNYGYSVVVASEGLKNNDGNLYAASDSKDSFGHTQLGGLAPKLAQLINNELKLKYHWSVSDYLQRSARHLASKTDLEQAFAVGVHAVKLALSGETGVMPIIKRVSIIPISGDSTGDLKDIANLEKTLPKEYISECGFRITSEGKQYLSPLIQGKLSRISKWSSQVQQLDLFLSD